MVGRKLMATEVGEVGHENISRREFGGKEYGRVVGMALGGEAGTE